MTPIAAVPSVINLSWNSARLLALILNALNGLIFYYDREYSNLSNDAIFGLRVIQDFHGRGYHKDIFDAIRNISINAGKIDGKILKAAEIKPDFKTFKSILEKPFWPGFNSLQQIDERFRWSDKEHFNEKKHRIWFDSENNENK
uniref:N-acetyltransferase domain-containing protein n=1 Tax=Panagrolaimus sp. PS1159 TaxID=55785 RepID=A0AC35GB62_9BILA